MTNKDAIELIEEIRPKKCRNVNGRLQGGFPDHDSDVGKAIDMAIEALEKQIPKKPKLDDEMGFFECTACGRLIGYMEDPKSHKYCLMCGQALDWSDEDDI